MSSGLVNMSSSGGGGTPYQRRQNVTLAAKAACKQHLDKQLVKLKLSRGAMIRETAIEQQQQRLIRTPP